jgi:hypothetical protein
MTREEWLNAVAARMAWWFSEAGKPLPKVRCSIGFPSKGLRSKTIGECWSNDCTADGVFEIYITPTIKDASRVADILAHELIHAAIGLEAKHGKEFRKMMKAIGLKGRATATVADALFLQRVAPILAEVGAFPHPGLNARVSSAGRKQPTRMLKCVCPKCRYMARTTLKWLELGTPICPVDKIPTEQV